MRTTSKFLLSAGLLASVLTASSAFAATTHKTHKGTEQQLPAQAQPAAMRNGAVVYVPAPVVTYGAEDPAKDAHWGPAHNASPAMW